MEQMLKICDIDTMNKEVRPVARLCEHGPESLIDNELLSVILEEDFVGDYGSLDLMHMSIDQMTAAGISIASAIKIFALCEYSKRLWRKELNLKRFSMPSDIADYMRIEMGWLEKEEFRVLCLDPGHRLLKELRMTTGTAELSLVSVREVLINALREKAFAIVIVHNHTCGSVTPSSADTDVTYKIRDGCRMIGLELLDHIIVCENSYYSFADNELL